MESRGVEPKGPQKRHRRPGQDRGDGPLASGAAPEERRQERRGDRRPVDQVRRVGRGEDRGTLSPRAC